MDDSPFPRWLWKAILGGMLVVGTLVLGVVALVAGASFWANLLPEGVLSPEGLTTQQIEVYTSVNPDPTPQASAPASAQPPTTSGDGDPDYVSPFACKWMVSGYLKHQGANGSYWAMDATPDSSVDPSTKKSFCSNRTLYAPISGKVQVISLDADPNPVGYGNYIIITGKVKGIPTKVLMAHFAPGAAGKSFALVQNGDVVTQGTPLGTMGTTGRSTGPHLHIELIVNGVRIQPEKTLPQAETQWAGTGIYKGEPATGIVQKAPERPTPVAPTGFNWLAQGLASLATGARELPSKAGFTTPRNATVDGFSVNIVDERVNKTATQFPDASLVAKRVVELAQGIKTPLTLKYVDKIESPEGNFATLTIPQPNNDKPTSFVILVDPDHPDSKKDTIPRVIAQELGQVVTIFNKSTPAGLLAQREAEEHVHEFMNVTPDVEVNLSENATSVPRKDELIVYVYVRPRQQGVDLSKPGSADEKSEAIRPQIEKLRHEYPWVEFIYTDAVKAGIPDEDIPKTVLTRGGAYLFGFVGDTAGLEDMLEINKSLGAQIMRSGNVPLLGSGVSGEPSKITFAGVYGSICTLKGSVGVPGQNITYPNAVVGVAGQSYPCTAEGVLGVTRAWGKWVSANNGGKPVVHAIMPTIGSSNRKVLDEVIELTNKLNNEGQEHWYVLLDEPGHSEQEIKTAMDRYTKYPHVGFTLDLEWFKRKVPISEINRVAAYYFKLREERGLKGLGILGFWYFDPTTLDADVKVTREFEKDVDIQSNYSTGIVVPLMDGIGSAAAKSSTYASMMGKSGARYGGTMGFRWRWGNKYESADEKQFFKPDILFWCQQ